MPLPMRILRYLKSVPRRLGTVRPGHIPQRAAWLLVLAVVLTSVTIAVIIPGYVDALPENARPSHAPVQTILLEVTSKPIEANRTEHSVAGGESAAGHTWFETVVRKGDTLSSILRQQGHDDHEIGRLIQTNPEARIFRHLRPGQTLRLRTGSGGPWQELAYETEPGEVFHIFRRADRLELTKEIRSFETRIAYVTGTIESSLFEDGQEAGLSDAQIMKLAEIFGWDIDFALDLRRGDSFSVIHEEKYWRGQKVTDGPILAAEFINQGNIFRAFAYRDVNGYTTYYAPDGTSVRRPFLRTPVEFSRITSRFTRGRFHPILKTWRAHKGVDYAAPVGTPVRATASGRILVMGWNGSYGKRIVIRHSATYSTVYAHLSRFNNSLHVGSFVEQGQTIGYVGATGLASGPHLHYEFQVDGVHRNPLTFRFVGSTLIAEEHRDDFTRIVKTWGARLDLIGRSALVASNR